MHSVQRLASLTFYLWLWEHMELVPSFKHCTGGSWRQQDTCPNPKYLISLLWMVAYSGKKAPWGRGSMGTG